MELPVDLLLAVQEIRNLMDESHWEDLDTESIYEILDHLERVLSNLDERLVLIDRFEPVAISLGPASRRWLGEFRAAHLVANIRAAGGLG